MESLGKPAPAVNINDEIAKKRAEIERQLSQRVAVVEAMEEDTLAHVDEDWATAPASPAAKPSPPRQAEESALARIKRERAEKRLAAAGDEDVDMRSGAESEHDEAMDSGAERFGARSFGWDYLLTGCPARRPSLLRYPTLRPRRKTSLLQILPSLSSFSRARYVSPLPLAFTANPRRPSFSLEYIRLVSPKAPSASQAPCFPNHRPPNLSMPP